eukprot:TRINITY_DN33612_c0_g1_i1.p1 TRINITY_DN33612_c0_g1~~TRINITY_DN33612_c0_g1_i1.p1  ORF type:complete len:344 (+),score=72.26 TRINITY_DN33612_c0_g1_i1:137-1168(+)
MLVLLGCAFTAAGLGWVGLQLLWAHPWLALIAAGVGCFAIHFASAVARGDTLQTLIGEQVSDSCRLTPFQLLQIVSDWLTLRVCHLVRLLILLHCDLDKEQHAELLDEMDDELRRQIFHKPAITLLPAAVQRCLVSEERLQDLTKEVEGSSKEVPLLQLSKRPEASKDAATDKLTKRKDSLNDVIAFLRKAEDSRKNRQVVKLAKIVNAKVSETAVAALKHGGQHQLGAAMSRMNPARSAQELVINYSPQLRSPPKPTLEGTSVLSILVNTPSQAVQASTIIVFPFRLARGVATFWYRLAYEIVDLLTTVVQSSAIANDPQHLRRAQAAATAPKADSCIKKNA